MESDATDLPHFLPLLLLHHLPHRDRRQLVQSHLLRYHPSHTHKYIIIITLTASSGKHNVTVWRPSVRPSVPSAYSP